MIACFNGYVEHLLRLHSGLFPQCAAENDREIKTLVEPSDGVLSGVIDLKQRILARDPSLLYRPQDTPCPLWQRLRLARPLDPQVPVWRAQIHDSLPLLTSGVANVVHDYAPPTFAPDMEQRLWHAAYGLVLVAEILQLLTTTGVTTTGVTASVAAMTASVQHDDCWVAILDHEDAFEALLSVVPSLVPDRYRPFAQVLLPGVRSIAKRQTLARLCGIDTAEAVSLSSFVKAGIKRFVAVDTARLRAVIDNPLAQMPHILGLLGGI